MVRNGRSAPRWIAILALSGGLLLGAPRVRAAPAEPLHELIRQLADENPLARRSAADALAERGAPAVGVLARALTRGPRPVRLLVVDTLRRIGAPALPALARALAEGPLEVQVAAAAALGALGATAAPATAALARRVKGGESSLAAAAASALGRIGPGAAAAAPALVQALGEQRPRRLQRAAARALGEIGPQAKAAIPRLRALSQGKHEPLAQVARAALEKISAPQPPTPAEPLSLPEPRVVPLASPDAAALERALAALVQDLLRGRWLPRKGQPRIEIAELRNRTAWHLSTQRLEVQLFRELSRQLRVRVVGGPRAQPTHVLSGALYSAGAARPGQELQSAIATLALVAVPGGEKVWVGLLPLRRLIERSDAGAPRVRTLGPREPPPFPTRFIDLDALQAGARLARRLLAGRALWGMQPRRLRVAPLGNRTADHVSTEIIVAQLERALIASGKLELLGDAPRSAAQISGPRFVDRAPAGELTLEGELRSDDEITAAGHVVRYAVTARILGAAARRELWSGEVKIDKRLR